MQRMKKDRKKAMNKQNVCPVAYIVCIYTYKVQMEVLRR